MKHDSNELMKQVALFAHDTIENLQREQPDNAKGLAQLLLRGKSRLDARVRDVLGAQPLGIYAIWKPKPWLSEWAREHTLSQPEEADRLRRSLPSSAFPGEDTADTQIAETLETPAAPPGGLYVTDDDYNLARANTSRDYLAQFRRGEIRPDCVITRLTDLLDIFPEVGKL